MYTSTKYRLQKQATLERTKYRQEQKANLEHIKKRQCQKLPHQASTKTATASFQDTYLAIAIRRTPHKSSQNRRSQKRQTMQAQCLCMSHLWALVLKQWALSSTINKLYGSSESSHRLLENHAVFPSLCIKYAPLFGAYEPYYESLGS